MTRRLRILSVSHSYVVALNRRWAHEMGRVGRRRWEVTAVSPRFLNGDLRPVSLERCTGESCRLEVVPAYFSGRVPVMIYGRRLKKLMDESWDVVHCWEEPYVLAGGQVARWTPSGTPLVYRTAQSLSKRYPPPFNWIERYAMGRSAGWICSGKTVAETLCERPGYRERPMRLIPLGVDVDHFSPAPATGAELRHRLGWSASGAPVVGYLGRFVPEKGLHLLMQTLGRLTTPWRALFVGAGPMEPALRDWAARHGDRVRVATGVKHDDVPCYLNAMDMMCAPSRSTPRWREQFGRMLTEAFACGVPVLGSDSGEIPHVIDDVGVVVGEQDTEAWVQAIGRLIESPKLRAELAMRGLERARSVYAWPIIARQTLEFFDDLLDYPRTAAA